MFYLPDTLGNLVAEVGPGVVTKRKNVYVIPSLILEWGHIRIIT